MADITPGSMALWPKLRRRASKGCKSWKAKGKQNPYASLGLEKFAVVYAELQARRDLMAEKVGAPVSMVRFLSRSAHSHTTALFSQVSSGKVKSPCEEDTIPVVVYLKSSPEVNSKSGNQRSTVPVKEPENSILEDDKTVGKPLDEVSLRRDDSLRMLPARTSAEVTLEREISLKDAFPILPLRGERSLKRRGQQQVYLREKRWRHVTKSAVVLAVSVIVYTVNRVADVGGSALGALSFGIVVRRWRKSKQFMSRLFAAIAKFIIGPLHSHITSLGGNRRLSFVPTTSICNHEDTEHSNVGTGTRRSACCSPVQRSPIFAPVSSPNSSPSFSLPSPSSPNVIEPAVTSLCEDHSKICRTDSAPILSASPRGDASSPPSSVERANKLCHFKDKIFKSFPLNRAVSSEREIACCASSSSMSEGIHGLFSRSEVPEGRSVSPTAENENRGLNVDDPVVKKKSFLQRRCLSRIDDNARERSDGTSSSPRTLQFAKLRISISRLDDDINNTSTLQNSPRTLRLGKLRISTSMKESPRKVEDEYVNSRAQCSSPGRGKGNVYFPYTDCSNAEISPARRSGLSVEGKSPVQQQEGSRLAQPKNQEGCDARLLVTLLVSMLFLLVGRVPAILATTVTLLIFSHFDKARNSRGVRREGDSLRRALEASRKLRKCQSVLSPHSGGSSCSPRHWSPRSRFVG